MRRSHDCHIFRHTAHVRPERHIDELELALLNKLREPAKTEPHIHTHCARDGSNRTYSITVKPVQNMPPVGERGSCIAEVDGYIGDWRPVAVSTVTTIDRFHCTSNVWTRGG